MYCIKCGGEFPSTARFCPYCGAEAEPSVSKAADRDVFAVPAAKMYGAYDAAESATEPKEKKSKKTWVIFAAIAGVLVLSAAYVFFFCHEWKSATCTEPKTCTICGTVEGSALGHRWEPATCLAPKTCSVCGETTGSIGEHQWINATYDTPKTCYVCGEIFGDVKGYTDYLDYTWSENTVLLEGWDTQWIILEREVESCTSFRVNLELVEGTNYGMWYIYAKDEFGNWEALATFDVETMTTDSLITLSPSETFSGLAFVPAVLSGGDYSIRVSIKDVYERP